jgi:phosphotransferase system IIA component
LKLFNIRQDCQQLIALPRNQTTDITFDTNYGYSFEVLDMIQLFLHVCFSDVKYNYVWENNESYHKLAKQDTL